MHEDLAEQFSGDGERGPVIKRPRQNARGLDVANGLDGVTSLRHVDNGKGRRRQALRRSPHRAEQGSGVNAAPSASFLKCVLCTNGFRRFSGSRTSVTMVIQTSPLGAVIRW